LSMEHFALAGHWNRFVFHDQFDHLRRIGTLGVRWPEWFSNLAHHFWQWLTAGKLIWMVFLMFILLVGMVMNFPGCSVSIILDVDNYVKLAEKDCRFLNESYFANCPSHFASWVWFSHSILMFVGDKTREAIRWGKPVCTWNTNFRLWIMSEDATRFGEILKWHCGYSILEAIRSRWKGRDSWLDQFCPA
jgi:hypothetical protein